jgi:hypothetical protein
VIALGQGGTAALELFSADSRLVGGEVFQVQTSNPDASVLAVTPQKGALLVGLVLLTFAVLGGLTTGLTLITQFLTREITHVPGSF